jgi:CRP-like cAMP-binding protein
MISIAQFLENTSGCEFLEGLERAHMERLASLAKEFRSKAGRVIFEDGARHGRFYLLCEGEVALEMGQRTLVKLKAGDALGWSSLTGSSGAHFRARALTPVYAMAFDGAQLAAACEGDPAFGYFIMKALLSVVTERLDAARMQLGAGDHT